MSEIKYIYSEAGLTTSETSQMPAFMTYADGFYDSTAFLKLYEYFAFKTGDMPYDIAKARTGDPDMWILERLESLTRPEGMLEALADLTKCL
jgi:hypothetical protein|tara:strand:- start:1595 stop:1870 length:276 start_codon:yes stop_codon:yes gene_type:complete